MDFWSAIWLAIWVLSAVLNAAAFVVGTDEAKTSFGTGALAFLIAIVNAAVAFVGLMVVGFFASIGPASVEQPWMVYLYVAAYPIATIIGSYGLGRVRRAVLARAAATSTPP